MKKLLPFLAAAALLFALTACDEPASNSDENLSSNTSAVSQDSLTSITFIDDLGRTVKVDSPKRVAVLTGSFADVWCLAGGKDSLVATVGDAWTSFDLDLDESVVDLGSVAAPNVELLLDAQPDLVLASSNISADLELQSTFEQMRLTVAYFDIQHFSDYLNMLDICTKITGLLENYDLYGIQIQTRVEQAIARQTGEHPTVLCIRTTGSKCIVKGSENFLLGEMLADLGSVNIADGNNALLENLSLEAIMIADPDYIFAVLHGVDQTQAMATLEQMLLSNPAWAGLRAVQEGRFFTLEYQLYNLKPNAHWGEAYEKLADILYPDSPA